MRICPRCVKNEENFGFLPTIITSEDLVLYEISDDSASRARRKTFRQFKIYANPATVGSLLGTATNFWRAPSVARVPRSRAKYNHLTQSTKLFLAENYYSKGPVELRGGGFNVAKGS